MPTKHFLKKQLTEREEQISQLEEALMNAKQSLKAAAKHITNLEDMVKRYKADVRGYNKCIAGMIAGQSPCYWCEDREECRLSEKDGKGCEDWWLAFSHPDVTEPEEEDADESKGIFPAGTEG